MYKLLILFFCFFTTLHAMDIDPKLLENIIEKNPKNIPERIILAKYYFQHKNDAKALLLLQEALLIDPKNKNAKVLQRKILQLEHDKEVLREASLHEPIDAKKAQERLQSYYNTNNYQFYSNLYQALVDKKVPLADEYHIKAAYIYLWDAHYKESEAAANRVQQKNNIDIAKIRADICYYTGKYKCAKRLYETLYNSSYSLEYGIKLIHTYIYLGEMQKATRLYNYLYRQHPQKQQLLEVGKKLSVLKQKYLTQLLNAYKESPNYTTLNNYISALYANTKKEEALKILRQYNERTPTKESLLLEAKYLIWENKLQEAMNLLNNDELTNNLEAKLMLGKIYSWNQHFEEAKQNLDYVLTHATDKNLLYEAKKAKAFVLMWEKNSVEAKKIFTELYNKNKNDQEVREALMELNHNYKGLLSIYKKRVLTSSDPQNKKRLAELYMLTKAPQKAIKEYEDYLKLNPNDLEAMKALALLLIENKNYYQGFGYLEYYTAQKQDTPSKILLAKNYYWSGFSKEALNVLEELLKKEPENKEALKLKGEILKIAPRFTTSNSGVTIHTFYDDLGKKQLFLADTLYFNTHYAAALKYYEDYLQTHPNDHDARYRYAFALENAKQYAQAEGEFSLLLWTKDNQETRYHYAYNLMKNGKLKEAKNEFKKLQQKTFKKLSPELKHFLDAWIKAWQSQNFPQYAQFYDKKIQNNKQWAYKKQFLFQNAKYIAVSIYDPYYRQDDNTTYTITFYQEYATDKKKDTGYKTLKIKCEQKDNCKIIEEHWKPGKYQKKLELTPYIEKSLKELEYLKSHPLALSNTVKKKAA